MNSTWNVIVVGAGAVGSAALYQLARRGVKALAIDRFMPPHGHGSSHGETRITRLALGEGERYLQFVRRSHEIWRELEATTGRTLLRQVGGLIYGSISSREAAHGAEDFLQTTIAVAARHGIPHEVLNAEAMRERFPQFRFRGDELGCFEPSAGFVHPEACIAGQLEVASHLGAVLRGNERVLAWRRSGPGVAVTTDKGVYEADRLILCAGAWLPTLAPALAASTRVCRQVLFWFEPDAVHELFGPERMPVYIRVPDAETDMFYGFPAIDGNDGGMKIAGEQFNQMCVPDEMECEVRPEESAAMHRLAAPHVRISARCLRVAACKYTVTPDFDFVIDQHPESDRVWMASPCSGHGFKHSAAVGEALAEMAIDGETAFDLSEFRLSRF